MNVSWLASFLRGAQDGERTYGGSVRLGNPKVDHARDKLRLRDGRVPQLEPGHRVKVHKHKREEGGEDRVELLGAEQRVGRRGRLEGDAELVGDPIDGDHLHTRRHEGTIGE